MSRCIIYEGVFDPPHVGHFWTLQKAKERLHADAVVVPASDNAAVNLSNKPNASPHALRYAWACQAFSNIAIVYNTDLVYTVDIVVDVVLKLRHYTKWYYLTGPQKDLSKYKNSFKIQALADLYTTPQIMNVRSTDVRYRIRNHDVIDGLLAPNLDKHLITKHFRGE